MVYLTRAEAEKALREGERVQFHWQGQAIEITLQTSLDDLRWALLAQLKLLISHVTNGNYSII